MAQFFKASRTKKQNNKNIKACTIEKLDHRGRGMFYHQNKPVFVEGVLTGELVDVSIIEDKKRYSRATLKKVVTVSEQRIQPQCQHYQECGGCQLQHAAESLQIEIKQAGLISLFQRFADITPSLQTPLQAEPWQYRRCARFALMFDRKSKTLQMGFRRAASKELVSQQVCPVLKPALSVLIKPLQVMLNQLQTKMSLGHIELVEAENGAAVLLRHLKPLNEHDLKLIREFAEQNQLHFYAQGNSGSKSLTATDELYYTLPEHDCRFQFNISDFIQVNSSINQQMVTQALNWLDLQATDSVLDLFCGLGNFTLPIAKQVASVVGVEGVDNMVQRATSNAQLNQLSNVRFFQADLSDLQSLKASWSEQGYDKVLLDPARAGAAQCMSFIVSKKPSRIVYVSCDPVTLARDSKTLLDNGYRLQKLGALDMFPHTEHIESMALFIRDKS